MNLSLYKKWVEEFKTKFPNLISNIPFKSIDYFEDITIISFKNNKNIVISENVIFTSLDNELPPFVRGGRGGLSERTNAFPMESERTSAFPTSSKPQTMHNHLSHSILKDVCILNNDKIIEFHFKKWNIYNEEQDLYLIVELIPRFHNIILCTSAPSLKNLCEEKENQIDDIVSQKIIIDCKKKITFSENQARQILPRCEYIPPKTDYIHNEEDVIYPIKHSDKSFYSVNDYFSFYFTNNVFQKKIDNLKNSLLNQVNKELNKAQNKLKKQSEELKIANDIEYWKICVELLKSSSHLIKNGMPKITLKNYFIEGFPEIEITLNPEYSPQKNFDFYLKKYKKSLNGQLVIAQNIEKTKAEIDLLSAQKELISDEMTYLGLKELQKAKPEKWGRGTNETSSRNLRFPSSSNLRFPKKLFRVLSINSDWEINIGKSSKENDLLTCKTAKLDDWWFHCRIFHGTHVVLRNFKKKSPPDELIVLCCRLAAYYSKAKNSSNVPVDFTQIKHVRKPKGSPTGYVVYKNQKTMYVNPIDFREALNTLKM